MLLKKDKQIGGTQEGNSSVTQKQWPQKYSLNSFIPRNLFETKQKKFVVRRDILKKKRGWIS